MEEIAEAAKGVRLARDRERRIHRWLCGEKEFNAEYVLWGRAHNEAIDQLWDSIDALVKAVRGLDTKRARKRSGTRRRKDT